MDGNAIKVAFTNKEKRFTENSVYSMTENILGHFHFHLPYWIEVGNRISLRIASTAVISQIKIMKYKSMFKTNLKKNIQSR